MANELGYQAAGTVSGTVSFVFDDLQAVEFFTKINSGTGTVTATFFAKDNKGSAYDTGVSVAHTGSATTKGTVLSAAGGVPLGFGGELRLTAAGTINYEAAVVGRF